jgi:hypothetical protein
MRDSFPARRPTSDSGARVKLHYNPRPSADNTELRTAFPNAYHRVYPIAKEVNQMATKQSGIITRAVLSLLLGTALIRPFAGDAQQVTRAPGLRGHECTMEGFARSSGWELIVFKEPFTVSQVRGCILTANNPLGQWPDLPERYIRLQLKRSGSDKVTFETFADQAGRFEIENVPEGRYCFFATALGWTSVIGVIVVDKKAAQERIVAFQVDLDK